jgi:hypothetical protein
VAVTVVTGSGVADSGLRRIDPVTTTSSTGGVVAGWAVCAVCANDTPAGAAMASAAAARTDVPSKRRRVDLVFNVDPFKTKLSARPSRSASADPKVSQVQLG